MNKEPTRDVYPEDPFRSDVFRRASALREQLERAEKLKYQQKGAAVKAIKRDALNLLIECQAELHLAMPLVRLFAALLNVSPDRYSWPPEKLLAVKFEASLPPPSEGHKRISPKRVATELSSYTEKNVEPITVKRWREDPEYDYLINVRRGPDATWPP